MLLGLSGPTSSFWVRAVFFELFLSQCQAQGVLINLVGSLIENVEVIFSQDCFLLEMKSTTNLIIVSSQLLCLCRSGNQHQLRYWCPHGYGQVLGEDSSRIVSICRFLSATISWKPHSHASHELSNSVVLWFVSVLFFSIY